MADPMTNIILDFGVEEVSNVGQMQGLYSLNKIVFNSNYGFMWPAPNMDFIVRCAYAERSVDSRMMTRAEAVVWYPLPPVLTMALAYVFGGGAPQGGAAGGMPSGLEGLGGQPDEQVPQQAVKRTWGQMSKDLFFGFTQRRSLNFGVDFGFFKDDASVDVFDNSNVLPDWRHALHHTGLQFGIRRILYKENTLFGGEPEPSDEDANSVDVSSNPSHLQTPSQMQQQSFYQLGLNFNVSHKQLEKAKSIWGNPSAGAGPASGGSRARLTGMDPSFEELEDEDDGDVGDQEESNDPETQFYQELKRTRPAVSCSFSNSAITHLSQLNLIAELELAHEVDILTKLRFQSETVTQPNERTRVEASFQLELVKTLQKGASPPPIQDPATGQDLQEYLSSSKNLFSETVRISRQFTDMSVTTVFTQIFSQTAELQSLISDTKYMIGLEHQHFTPVGEAKASFFFPFFDPQNGFSFQVELKLGTFYPSQEELDAMMKAESEARYPDPVSETPPDSEPVLEEEPAPAPKKKWSLFGKKSDESTSSIKTTQLLSTTEPSPNQYRSKLGQITQDVVNRVLNEQELRSTARSLTVREQISQMRERFAMCRRSVGHLFNWSQRRFGMLSSLSNWRRLSFSNNFVRLLPSSHHVNSFAHQY